jgi:hypothetical protein
VLGRHSVPSSALMSLGDPSKNAFDHAIAVAVKV